MTDNKIVWQQTKKQCPKCGGYIKIGLAAFESASIPMAEIVKVECAKCKADYSDISFSKIGKQS